MTFLLTIAISLSDVYPAIMEPRMPPVSKLLKNILPTKTENKSDIWEGLVEIINSSTGIL